MCVCCEEIYQQVEDLDVKWQGETLWDLLKK